MKWESYSHPISDIRDWYKANRLELRPDFQRNEVWSKAAQIMLIDTIINGIPIPKIYIKSIVQDENTYRVVVDGQQRLTAILKFLKDELELQKPYKGKYIGKTFSTLPDDVHDNFLRYKIDINEIFNPTEEEIRDLYSRVNKYTVQLNKQELRKADFPGDCINLSEHLAENEFFSDAKIFTVKQRRRMLDVEYIEELLAIVLDGTQDKRDYLDSFCENHVSIENCDEVEKTFVGTLEDIKKIFDGSSLNLSKTRFRQKSDFYSLFACVLELRQNGEITEDSEKLENVRKMLREMDAEIGPQSEDKLYLEYATRCLSDANSKSNRDWRVAFLKERIAVLYS